MKKLIHKADIINEGRKYKGSVLIENDRIKAIYTLDDNSEALIHEIECQ